MLFFVIGIDKTLARYDILDTHTDIHNTQNMSQKRYLKRISRMTYFLI